MKRETLGILVLGVLLVTAGCNTPSYRISRNQALFDSFPSDVQANIRKGAIDIGYTKPMVRLALGEPDREYLRRTAMGRTEVWSYTDIYTTLDRQRVTGSFRVRDSGGRLRTVSDSVWVDVDREHEYERRRVEFENGRVKAIEEISRDR
jgi:hypothetical protein